MALAAMRRDIHSTMSHGEDVLLEELSSRLKGVLPVQPSPLLVPSDNTSSSLKSTMLGGHLISCFVIGGECRLCFPQIISVVLQGVKVDDVNDLFVDLNIHISVASQQQLDTLKLAGVMPMTADSCGLVTKSDAERLVAKLLPQTNGPLRLPVSRDDAVPVCHDCFGGCSGLLLPSLQCDECIECNECKYMFTGEKFVAHTHSLKEIQRVCHWGFDSANWKYYLRIAESHERDVRAVQRLDNFKNPHLRIGKRHSEYKVGPLTTIMNVATCKAPTIYVKQNAVRKHQNYQPYPSRTDMLAFMCPFACQHGYELNDLDGLPTKLMGMEPCSLLELGQLMSSRAMIPLSSGSLLGAQMCSLSPQLQSLFALQLAAAASQLPLAAVPAQSQTQAQPSVANCVKLGAETKLQQQQTGGGPVVCGGADRLVKPVPLKSDLCIVDESNCLSKKISTSELALNGTVNPNTALSLEKLLEENLKEPALSLAKMMLAENGRAEARKRDELSAQVEQLRRENCILRGALSRNTLCIPQTLTQKTSIC